MFKDKYGTLLEHLVRTRSLCNPNRNSTFHRQDDCARNCMIQALPARLGCDSINCICDEGRLPLAISAILSCGQLSCSPGLDIATATNVVTSYCRIWSETALQRRIRALLPAEPVPEIAPPDTAPDTAQPESKSL